MQIYGFTFVIWLRDQKVTWLGRYCPPSYATPFQFFWFWVLWYIRWIFPILIAIPIPILVNNQLKKSSYAVNETIPLSLFSVFLRKVPLKTWNKLLHMLFQPESCAFDPCYFCSWCKVTTRLVIYKMGIKGYNCPLG